VSLPTLHVVGAAILRDGTCLAAQRGPVMSLPLQWEFPGGKVEDGESAADALVREIKEEFGVDVDVGEFVGEGTAEVGDRHIWLEVYRARIVSGKLTVHEHAAVRWVGEDEIAELGWAEADLPVVPAVRALLAGS
jgi:8-oxo-dGTP diphosphatase